MKKDFSDTKLDELIRESMKTTDEPSVILNNTLKASLYSREAASRKTARTRPLFLWYLPMILNVVIFALLAAAAFIGIQNPYLSFFAAGICIYAGLAGIVLTAVGMKRSCLKDDLTLYIHERGETV